MKFIIIEDKFDIIENEYVKNPNSNIENIKFNDYNLLKTKKTYDEIINDYPELTKDNILCCIEYANNVLNKLFELHAAKTIQSAKSWRLEN